MPGVSRSQNEGWFISLLDKIDTSEQIDYNGGAFMNTDGGGLMKLQKLEIYDFKGIASLSLDLEGKDTVFVGVNGSGKSSILRAVNLLFSNIINRIVSNQFKQGIFLKYEDIQYGKTASKIVAQFLFDDNTTVDYYRSIDKKEHKKYHTKKSLDEFAEHFKALYLDEDSPDSTMPIFVNYGVNRAVLDVPIRVRRTHTFGREAAFLNAIENKIDFRVFFEWFRNQQEVENAKARELNDFNYQDLALLTVKEAMTALLPNISNIRITHNPLHMKATKDGASLCIEHLSDGEKCTLAIFGDLARRLAIANPHLENPLLGGGIVLIDEIELHMHPSWQRKVVPVLKQTFPNVQFIITTHSPQVLGEISLDMNVFFIFNADGNVTAKPMRTFGLDSNMVLEEIMGTRSVNQEVAQKIVQMFNYIDEKDYHSASMLADEIDMLTEGRNVDTVEARILIDRGMRYEANH